MKVFLPLSSSTAIAIRGLNFVLSCILIISVSVPTHNLECLSRPSLRSQLVLKGSAFTSTKPSSTSSATPLRERDLKTEAYKREVAETKTSPPPQASDGKGKAPSPSVTKTKAPFIAKGEDKSPGPGPGSGPTKNTDPTPVSNVKATSTPTHLPTRKPTRKPEKQPTKKPTRKPTRNPTEEPTEPPKPAQNTTTPPYPPPSRNPATGTASPTFEKSEIKSPSSPPTDGPTATSTKAEPVAASTDGPIVLPTPKTSKAPVVGTVAPTTEAPSVGPTESPLTKPVTSSPTKDAGTESPTSSLVGPTETTNLKVTLSGITSINSNQLWERTTENLFENLLEDDPDIDDVDIIVTITSVQTNDGGSRKRRLYGRSLQSTDASVEVTYTQMSTYRTKDAELTNDKIVVMPLSTQEGRDQYIGELKQLNGYEDLTAVSEISISSNLDKGIKDDNVAEPDNVLPVGVIIIIVIACVCTAVAVLTAGYEYYRHQKGKEKVGDVGENTLSSTQDQTRTGTSGAGTGSSIPTYGDMSGATVDYDYSRAYGGAGNHSLSDAGGTFGSGTRQTGLDGPGMFPGSGNTIFSDDPIFERAYEEMYEELLDIYVPAGKLGVVIDTPDDGAPVVHVVKDTSPLCDKVQVGDKLVAVDDEDVRAMTAIKVSKLISRKSNNASRKLTIIRHVSNG